MPDSEENVIFIDINSELLEINTPFQIINPHNKVIIMNVIGENHTLNVRSKIEYNKRSNHETEDFSDANLIWNFGNSTKNLNIEAPFLGTILAPKANINVNQNLDGSIIGRNININSETHRWDPNPIFPKLGSVELIKEDAVSHELLSGAIFSLYNESGEELASNLTTNEAGIITYSGLSVGSYYFVETTAPTGYQLDNSPQRFEIKSGETSKVVRLRLGNERVSEETGSVELIKEDAVSHELLSGAIFSLYNESGEELASNLTTNEAGIIAYSGLSVGSYYFVETTAPTGYQLDNSPQRFEITSKQAVKMVVKNKKDIVYTLPRTGYTFEVISIYIGFLVLLCVSYLFFINVIFR
nr:SpaA isopeptide-forming pilin-related protein [Vagococcus martis]